MHRRHLLRLLGTASATIPFLPRTAEGAVALGHAAHRAARLARLQVLTPEQAAVVTAVAERVIPRTETPGATDVNVTAFIDHMLAQWYRHEERADYLAGLEDLDATARQRFARPFVELHPGDQTTLLQDLDGRKGEPGTAAHAFARTKALTVYGYFTSEQVMTEVTREPVIPGRFDGCVVIGVSGQQ